MRSPLCLSSEFLECSRNISVMNMHDSGAILAMTRSFYGGVKYNKFSMIFFATNDIYDMRIGFDASVWIPQAILSLSEWFIWGVLFFFKRIIKMCMRWSIIESYFELIKFVIIQLIYFYLNNDFMNVA